uniref:Uncharacterized protein n=1 Tax=Anguilla anguilla TaxID=7936 RepID=A0A0E9PMX1_ANGAN
MPVLSEAGSPTGALMAIVPLRVREDAVCLDQKCFSVCQCLVGIL